MLFWCGRLQPIERSLCEDLASKLERNFIWHTNEQAVGVNATESDSSSIGRYFKVKCLAQGHNKVGFEPPTTNILNNSHLWLYAEAGKHHYFSSVKILTGFDWLGCSFNRVILFSRRVTLSKLRWKTHVWLLELWSGVYLHERGNWMRLKGTQDQANLPSAPPPTETNRCVRQGNQIHSVDLKIYKPACINDEKILPLIEASRLPSLPVPLWLDRLRACFFFACF